MFKNPPFPRPAEPPIKPQYIVLFKGDDSDFQGNQSVDVVIDTELDTTGMKAHFRFMDFVQDFDSIPENKTLSLVFPNAKTSEFPLGAADATLRFEDASGKFRTISNRIHIVVTNSVHEAYDNEDSQSITVTVKGTVKWETIEGKPTFSTVATSGSYNDLLDKPTIPAPVTIDSALSQTSENPVQNKVVAKALYTGFTEWVCDSIESGYTFISCVWSDYMDSTGWDSTGWVCTVLNADDTTLTFYLGSDQKATSLSCASPSIIITRHLITPTKTSQLTNDSGFLTQHQDISGKLDGAAAYPAWEDDKEYAHNAIVSHNGRLWKNKEPDNNQEPSAAAGWIEVSIGALKQDALLPAQMDAVNSGATAAKVAAWDGYAAQIAAKANAADVNAALAQKAFFADLPYAMVTPGEWEFSDGEAHDISGPGLQSDDMWYYELDGELYSNGFESISDALSALSIVFSGATTITATRASLPGHILDRAVNAVPVTGATTLTLPALVNAGKARDFLVRLEISGSTVPTITFAAPTGETITYETDGDEFPVPDEVGTWSYSFTETASHTFAMSLKKVNTVTQGGS